MRWRRGAGAAGVYVLTLLSSALAIACSRAQDAKVSSPQPGRFGAADPRRGRPALLAQDAPNTTMLAMDAGITGDRISGLLEIPERSCAVVIARAGASIEDLDLFAYGEDGSVVATDEAPDKTPAILICPPHPRRVWVSARIAAGHGLVAIGAQHVAVEQAQRTSTVYGVKSAAPAGGWPGLEERIEAHRRSLGGEWQELRRMPVPLDARIPTRLSAQVDAGRCIDAFLMPSDEVGHLELTALDAEGGILGRAETSGRERFIVACSAAETPISLEIRPQSGRGLGVFVLSRTRPGGEQGLDSAIARIEAYPRSDLEIELRAVNDELHRKGYTRAQKLTTGTLEVSRRTSTTVQLAAGCTRLDIVGGAPLRGIEARLWSGSGMLVSEARGGGRATLFGCDGAGTARLDVEATLRAGPFAVVARKEVDAPAPLAAHPLAAGRLLAHVIARDIVRRASDVGQVTEVDLSSTRLVPMDLTVPFGRCVDVTLALGADTLGAEIRLVATGTGAQIALSRAPHAASARVCSLDAASAHDNLRTRAEFRVSSGAGKGLVATRLLSPPR